MKKFIILIIGLLFISCGNTPVSENVPETIQKINTTNNDERWVMKNYKYMVRTQNIVLATNKNYKIGDTLKIE